MEEFYFYKQYLCLIVKNWFTLHKINYFGQKIQIVQESYAAEKWKYGDIGSLLLTLDQIFL